MTRLILLFALTTLSTTIHADGNRWSVRQMTDAVYSSKPDTNALNEATLCGRIVYQRQERKNDAAVAVEDSTGNMLVICTNWPSDRSSVKPGCEVEFSGLFTKDFNQKRFLIATRCRIIRTGPAPIPLDVRIADLLDGKHDFQLSRISGTLRDASFSETCPGWIILVLCEKSERIYLFVPDSHNLMAQLRQHLGEQVSASGICTPYDASARLKGGRIFKIASGKGLSFSGTAETPGTECPPISEIRCTREAEILSLGHHYVVGHVLAVWQNRNILLKTPAGDVVGLTLATENQPRFGDTIKAVGLPESDLFRINLTHCTWTRMPAADADEVPARSVSPRSISSVHDGYELIDNDFHGQSLQMSGLVRGLPNDGSNQMHIECDGRMVVVDASANAAALTRISVGCTVNVSGTCVILHEKRPHAAAFPHLKDFILVLRTPDDIHVLARPSWWTSGRLLAVIGTLVAVLLGILVWNAALRRAAVHKGRELLHEQLGHVKAELKTEERTRLAVELHDSLAQNLTGVSLEIDTATKLADEDPRTMKAHLGVAARSLKSCRDELRNCLWDLRNRALEAETMDAAIRQTLAPHLGGVELALRFNVPRERISDNTAHAILRIIRELTLNGVRHGGAGRIWIAGSVDGDRLLFSVRDNGCGFDPDAAPGFSEGHYGLLGIQKRVDEFEGEFTLRSSPGKGTKATVSLNVPQEVR